MTLCCRFHVLVPALLARSIVGPYMRPGLVGIFFFFGYGTSSSWKFWPVQCSRRFCKKGTIIASAYENFFMFWRMLWLSSVDAMLAMRSIAWTRSQVRNPKCFSLGMNIKRREATKGLECANFDGPGANVPTSISSRLARFVRQRARPTAQVVSKRLKPLILCGFSRERWHQQPNCQLVLWRNPFLLSSVKLGPAEHCVRRCNHYSATLCYWLILRLIGISIEEE